MLPGLRFLFVAIVLSTSALIFGLGAAALLRSAHEEFSNLPNRRAPPETVFAQPLEASRPTLAMLQVNTPVTAQKDIAPPAAPNEPNPAPALEQPSPMAPPEPDRTGAEPAGAATPTAAAPSEEKSESSEKSANQPPETPAPAEMPAHADIAALPLVSQAPETQTTEPRAAATAATTTPPAATSAPTSAEAIVAAPPPPVTVAVPMPAPISESANGASDKIATLGGPAVTIEPAPRVAVEDHPAHRAHPAEIVHVRRPLKRRRILHARAAPPPPVAFGAFQTPPAAAGSTRQN
jgi:hypothetical protein